MVEAVHIKFQLPDRSYQAIVRSEIRKLAESVGFSGHRLGEMEIIIAEITSNLIKHTDKGGTILVRPIHDQGGLEIIAIDEGPGMRMLSKMMEDGHSTKRTLGQGLGAIRRLSNEFDLYSLTGWGTVLFTRTYITNGYKAHNDGPFSVDILAVPKDGEKVSGDSWRYIRKGNRVRLALIDGLGHGLAAHIVAQEARKLFRQDPKITPTEQIRSLHEGLKKTRGAVMSVVYLDLLNEQMMYSGVGNITMRIISASRAQGCFSYNGIVGHVMPAVLNNHTFQWNGQTDMIVMHSDGLTSRWDIQKYPGILQHHSMIIGATLYKDFNRGNDDSTILIGRLTK